MRSACAVAGWIQIIVRDAITGLVLVHHREPNTIVNTGLDLIAERLRGNTGEAGLSHYAIGTDNTPPVAGDAALHAEAYRDLITQTRVSGGQLIVTLELGATQGNGLTFQEGGAFTPQNIMLCRGIYPAVSKTSAKILTVIHTIPFTAL